MIEEHSIIIVTFFVCFFLADFVFQGIQPLVSFPDFCFLPIFSEGLGFAMCCENIPESGESTTRRSCSPPPGCSMRRGPPSTLRPGALQYDAVNTYMLRIYAPSFALVASRFSP